MITKAPLKRYHSRAEHPLLMRTDVVMTRLPALPKGAAMMCFIPGKMSFEEYFCLDGHSFEDQIVRFVVGMSPSMQQRHYLVRKSSVNFTKKDAKVPSTCMGISLAAGVLCSNALKLILNRGVVVHAPHGLHFDAYRNTLVKTYRPGGNKHWKQRFMCWYLKRMLAKGDK